MKVCDLNGNGLLCNNACVIMESTRFNGTFPVICEKIDYYLTMVRFQGQLQCSPADCKPLLQHIQQFEVTHVLPVSW